MVSELMMIENFHWSNWAGREQYGPLIAEQNLPPLSSTTYSDPFQPAFEARNSGRGRYQIVPVRRIP
jgi:hypothetical protein